MGTAFQRPKTPAHLQFAYYEASLIIEWLVQKWGMEKLRACLADLGRGLAMNAALAANFAPVEKLDAEFAEFAKARAKATGPRLDWTEPKRGEIASAQKLDEWLAKNPDNFTALNEKAAAHLRAREWEAAKKPLRRLIELYPDQHDSESAYAQLAIAHNELGEFAEEEAMLKKVADLCADAPDAYERLMEIAARRKEWKAVLEWSQRFTAVNPLLPAPHRHAAEAREASGDKPGAIASYRTLLALDPPDPAGVHFSLAKLLHATAAPDAKKHALLALEEAPRFRAAHELLLELSGAPAAKSPAVKKQ
jgi:tetratricopeptide (TPR) repeat protein